MSEKESVSYVVTSLPFRKQLKQRGRVTILTVQRRSSITNP